MRCEEAQELLTDYADNQLSEVTRRRVSQHLESCDNCRSEYRVWAESGKWIRAEKQQYTNVSTAKSIVDAVMARILSEEKWAIPIGKKVFTVTAKMRRLGVSVAILLFMISGLNLYSTSGDDSFLASPIVPTAKTEVMSASIQTKDGIVEVLPETSPSSDKEVAAIAPVSNDLDNSGAVKPNYGLILSVFGILITVIGMSWLTRA